MRVLFVLLLASSFVFAQSATPPVKMNWRERLYRGYRVEDLHNAEKRLASAQETLDLYLSSPKMLYPEHLDQQKAEVAKRKAKADAAREELAKVDAMLENPPTRKAFNKEAKAIFKQRNEEIRAANSSRSPTRLNFRIDCYSGGYGRRFWVRCTSIWY